MNPLDVLFVAVGGGLAFSGLLMVGAAVRAYAQTERRVMVHLSVGFTLIVAATVATTLSGLLTGFEDPRRIFVVNNGLSMIGYLFVIYSVAAFR